jgi:hypothetical protein
MTISRLSDPLLILDPSIIYHGTITSHVYPVFSVDTELICYTSLYEYDSINDKYIGDISFMVESERIIIYKFLHQLKLSPIDTVFALNTFYNINQVAYLNYVQLYLSLYYPELITDDDKYFGILNTVLLLQLNADKVANIPLQIQRQTARRLKYIPHNTSTISCYLDKTIDVTTCIQQIRDIHIDRDMLVLIKCLASFRLTKTCSNIEPSPVSFSLTSYTVCAEINKLNNSSYPFAPCHSALRALDRRLRSSEVSPFWQGPKSLSLFESIPERQGGREVSPKSPKGLHHPSLSPDLHTILDKALLCEEYLSESSDSSIITLNEMAISYYTQFQNIKFIPHFVTPSKLIDNNVVLLSCIQQLESKVFESSSHSLFAVPRSLFELEESLSPYWNSGGRRLEKQGGMDSKSPYLLTGTAEDEESKSGTVKGQGNIYFLMRPGYEHKQHLEKVINAFNLHGGVYNKFYYIYKNIYIFHSQPQYDIFNNVRFLPTSRLRAFYDGVTIYAFPSWVHYVKHLNCQIGNCSSSSIRAHASCLSGKNSKSGTVFDSSSKGKCQVPSALKCINRDIPSVSISRSHFIDEQYEGNKSRASVNNNGSYTIYSPYFTSLQEYSMHQ